MKLNAKCQAAECLSSKLQALVYGPFPLRKSWWPTFVTGHTGLWNAVEFTPIDRNQVDAENLISFLQKYSQACLQRCRVGIGVQHPSVCAY